MKKLLLLTLILCLVLPCFGCNQGDLPPAGDGTTDGREDETSGSKIDQTSEEHYDVSSLDDIIILDPGVGDSFFPDSQYTILSSGFGDGISSAIHILEYPYISQSYVDESAKELTHYKGESLVYLESAVSGNTRAVRHKYKTNFGKWCMFDSKGNLAGCDFVTIVRPLLIAPKNPEDFINIASTYLKNFISLDNYEVEYVVAAYVPENSPHYIKFTRKYGNLLSEAIIQVIIHEDGHILNVSSHNFHEIPEDMVFDFDMEEVERIVTEKLDYIYSVTKLYMDVIYDEYQYEVTVLEDGKPAIECTVDVDCIDRNGVSWGSCEAFVISQ